ncbi:dTMP kinase [Sciscionella sediminilitoris]|uniref:dTMP kinase n=1 Tax=Sciscionella sediminilitoris TaxID=1445613 RepID=UPI0004DF9713|nr:dTMP kinase [Sciscionella sp. SE31]
MSALVAIEGLDGAGKRTLTTALTAELERCGARVTQLAFPRYSEDIHAELASDALHGRLGDLADSVYAMTLLFALDRRGAREAIEKLLATHDVVLADRYLASNAAYSAARLGQGADGEFVEWLRALELDRFGLRAPDLQVLLDVDAETAQGRAEHRESVESDRARDSYESDGGLQRRCLEVYRELAVRNWVSPWHVVAGTTEGTEAEAKRLGQLIYATDR